jgi:hypothetical protein
MVRQVNIFLLFDLIINILLIVDSCLAFSEKKTGAINKQVSVLKFIYILFFPLIN